MHFHPATQYDPSREQERIFRDVMDFAHASSETRGNGSVLTRSNFQALHPFIYFNLETQEESVKDSYVRLQFHYELTLEPNDTYNPFALILSEKELQRKWQDLVEVNFYLGKAMIF